MIEWQSVPVHTVVVLAAFLVLPLVVGHTAGAELEPSLFFALAVMGVSVLGSLMAGWSSANTFSPLGGWHGPQPTSLGWLWTLLEIRACAFVVTWVWVAFPRLREDQLQRLAWVWLGPVAPGQLDLTTAGVLAT